MTGTAVTEADEFFEIYKLGVVEVPTNMPVIRAGPRRPGLPHRPREVRGDRRGDRARPRGRPADPRRHHLDREVREPLGDAEDGQGPAQRAERPLPRAGGRHHRRGRRARRGDHRHQHGRPRHRHPARRQRRDAGGAGARGGRGGRPATPTRGELRRRIEAEIADAKARVLAAGGLYVLATERHESRRIDNQLRGRSGRQGDPGRTNFYLSPRGRPDADLRLRPARTRCSAGSG